MQLSNQSNSSERMSNLCPLESEQSISMKISAPMLKSPFSESNQNVQRPQPSPHFMKEEDPEALSVLNFAGRNLHTLPIQVASVKNILIEIDLSNNHLRSIPIELAQCSNLKSLLLSNNQIITIPNYLAQLTNLEQFDLRQNQIKVVPSIIIKFRALRVFQLCHNLIQELPTEIFTLKLKNLAIKSNNFTEIPYQFYNLLETLEIIELDWFTYVYPAQQEIVLFKFQPDVHEQLTQLAYQANHQKQNITFEYFINSISTKVLDLNSINSKGQSILFEFIIRESLGLIRYLCNKQKDICYRCDNDGVNPIVYSYNLRKPRCLQVLLQFYHSYSDILNILYMIVVKKLDMNTLRQLIERGIDINYKADKDYAGGNFGLHPRQRISKGCNALHVVICNFGRNITQQAQAASIAAYLLQCGCDPNMKNMEKETCLIQAIKLPSLAAIKWCVNYNQQADQEGRSEKMQFQFSKRDRLKNSGLHVASNLGLVSIMQLIFTMRVNPFLLNRANKTAKGVAISSLQVIKLLRKYEMHYLRGRMQFLQSENDRNRAKNQNMRNLCVFDKVSRPASSVLSGELDAIGETDLVNDDIQETNPNVSKMMIPSFCAQGVTQTSRQQKFRLNLGAIRQQEGLRSDSNRHQSSSRKEGQDELYREVSRIIRKCANMGDIFKDMMWMQNGKGKVEKWKMGLNERILIDNEQDDEQLQMVLSEKIIINNMMSMIVIRAKYGWKLGSKLVPGVVILINQMHFADWHLIANHAPSNYTKANELAVKFMRFARTPKLEPLQPLTGNQLLVQPIVQYRNDLSHNLIYDVTNYWQGSQEEAQEFYEETVKLLSFNYTARLLKLQQQQQYQTYETLHNNQYASQKYMKSRIVKTLRIVSPNADLGNRKNIYACQTSRIDSESGSGTLSKQIHLFITLGDRMAKTKIMNVKLKQALQERVARQLVQRRPSFKGEHSLHQQPNQQSTTKFITLSQIRSPLSVSRDSSASSFNSQTQIQKNIRLNSKNISQLRGEEEFYNNIDESLQKIRIDASQVKL